MSQQRISLLLKQFVGVLTVQRSFFPLTERRSFRILWCAIVSFVLLFFGACVLKYYAFSYRDYDLAYFSQIVWNILHGSINNSILGIPFLGVHVQLIWFLVAPFYAICPHPLTLLLLQSLLLGTAALPLYYLGRHFFDPGMSLAIAVSYLLYPAVAYLNLVELHSTAFVPFFLLWAFLFFFRDRFGLFLIFLSLAVFCQENISLAAFGLSFYAWRLKKSAKWIVVPGLLFGIYFLLCVWVIMPFFNRNTVQWMSIYGHLGSTPRAMLLNMIFFPGRIFQIMFGPYKIHYLVQLFAPLGFFPLFSPTSLLAAFPLFAQHLLSNRISQTMIYYHYTAEIIPFIFLGLVVGLNNLSRSQYVSNVRKWTVIGLILSSLFFAVTVDPLGVIRSAGTRSYEMDDADVQKNIFLAQIPPEEAVVATFQFLPHLTHRRELYSFHHQYTGLYSLSNRPYELPETVRFALLDFDDDLTFRGFYTREGYKNIQKFLDGGSWGVIQVRDNIVLFGHGIPGRQVLFEVKSSCVVPENRREVSVDHAMSFLGFDKLGYERGVFAFSLYWRSDAKTDSDRSVYFDFVDEAGTIVYRSQRPMCYRIFPTHAWQAGQFIKENVYMTVPTRLPAGRYRIIMGIYEPMTGRRFMSSPEVPLGRIPLMELTLSRSS